jgi:penicillin-binding protein 1C
MGFRDAWAVAAFDGYVLAVWVGNFDGRRNAALVGRTCAGPLLFQMIDSMRAQGGARPSARKSPAPAGANLRQVQLCATSGQLPSAACRQCTSGWFIPGISPITTCEVHRQILVDDETGLRLPIDDGTRPLHREVVEFWPTDLLSLFDQAGLPRRRPPPFPPGTGMQEPGGRGHPPEIVSPAHGRTYAVEPHADGRSSLALQARSEADTTRLYWFAGKTFLGSCPPRQALAWRATPGSYRITVLDDHGRCSTASVNLQSTSTR